MFVGCLHRQLFLSALEPPEAPPGLRRRTTIKWDALRDVRGRQALPRMPINVVGVSFKNDQFLNYAFAWAGDPTEMSCRLPRANSRRP